MKKNAEVDVSTSQTEMLKELVAILEVADQETLFELSKWSGKYRTDYKIGGEQGEWKPLGQFEISEQGIVLWNTTPIKQFKFDSNTNILTWSSEGGNPMSATLSLCPFGRDFYYWDGGTFDDRCFIGAIQEPGQGGADVRGAALPSIELWRGKYETDYKIGGVSGKWQHLGELEIIDKNTVLWNKIFINEYQFDPISNTLSWELKNNPCVARFSFQSSGYDQYYWEERGFNDDCFNGMFQS